MPGKRGSGGACDLRKQQWPWFHSFLTDNILHVSNKTLLSSIVLYVRKYERALLRSRRHRNRRTIRPPPASPLPVRVRTTPSGQPRTRGRSPGAGAAPGEVPPRPTRTRGAARLVLRASERSQRTGCRGAREAVSTHPPRDRSVASCPRIPTCGQVDGGC